MAHKPRRILTAVLAVAAVVSTQLPQKASAIENVQELFHFCNMEGQTDPALVLRRGQCLGYIRGVADLMLINGLGPDAADYGICSKRSPTTGAAAKAFKIWAKFHPDRWSEEPLVGVVLALRDVWPCK